VIFVSKEEQAMD